MKGIALTIGVLGSQLMVCFAGPPPPSKEIVAPPPPPVSYLRGNEFDIGVFGTYVTGTSGGGTRTSRTFANGDVVTLSSSGSTDAWGGGMDFTYFFAWKYLGI